MVLIISITAVSAQDSSNTDINNDISMSNDDSNNIQKSITTTGFEDSNTQQTPQTSNTQSHSTGDSYLSSSSDTQSTNSAKTQTSSLSDVQSTNSVKTQSSDSIGQVSGSTTKQVLTASQESVNDYHTIETEGLLTDSSLEEDDSPIESSIHVSNQTIYYGQSVQLEATVVSTNTGEFVSGGNVEFNVNDVTVGYANLTDGKAYFDYDSTTLPVNEYTLSASYSGTTTVDPTTSNNATLTVLKHTTDVTTSYNTVDSSVNVELVATVIDTVTNEYVNGGEVTFKINDETVGRVNISNGRAVLDHDSTTILNKNCTLSVIYHGTDTLGSSTSSCVLILQKHDSILSISNKTIMVCSNVELVVTVVDLSTGDYATSGTVAFKVNGKTVGYSDVLDGKAYLVYDSSSLSAKNYTLSATYGGNDLVNSNRTEVDGQLVILKYDTTVYVDNCTVYKSDTVDLVVTVMDTTTGGYATSGQVAFKINGKTQGYANVSNGKAHYTLTTNDLSAKTYTISASYGGGGVYSDNKTVVDGILDIQKHPSVMTISDKTIYYGDKVQLVVTVVDEITGGYATNGTVAFKVNGKTVGYCDLSEGKAYFTYDSSSLSAKNYTLSASYGGSSTVDSTKTNVNGTLVIQKYAVSMTINSETVLQGITSVELVVTVVDNDTKSNITGGTVVFKFGGVTIGNSTLQNGKAYLVYNFTAVAGRTYELSATYSGTSKYDQARTTTSSYLTVTSLSFTYDEIKDAAVYLRNHYESNDIITQVPIGSTTIGVEDFLPIMIKLAKNIYQGKGAGSIEYYNYGGVTSQSDTVSTKTFSMSTMISIGSNVLNFYQENGRAPRYATINSQQIGFYNLVYTFSKIIDKSTTKYLTSTCKVYNWNSIHPASSTSRTIYITSDIIRGSSKDREFMNSIKTALEKRGYNVVISDYGSNAHNTKIRADSLPDNAVQVSIFGGADAGVIYDMCTRSYMQAKSNRLVFIVYYPTATDITGLSWLPRSGDDNYSPSSFTGISNPDEYLKEHGYDYIYSSDPEAIADAIIKYIS